MSDYISDALLVLSLIAPPTILGILLFYGLSMGRRHHSDADEEPLSPPKGRSPTVPRAH